MLGLSSTLEPSPYNDEEREGEEQEEVGGEGEEFDESGDLFSGAKEFESHKQAQAIKKKIQFNLGRRSGPRWSLPFGRWSCDSHVMFFTDVVLSIRICLSCTIPFPHKN